MAKRGKAPNYTRRERAENVAEILADVRAAHVNEQVARGHLIAHQRAARDAAQRAYDAGATLREIAEARGQRYHKGVNPLRPTTRRARRQRAT